MRHAPAFGLALVLGTACAAGRLDAQQTGPVRESAEVFLVEVPVRALDRSGEPIRGLTARDFTLTDQGRRQEILAVDAIDLAERAPSGGSAPPPAARRRFLMLFDLSFARPKAIVAARRAAKDFVLEGLADGDLAAVATYTVEQGVRLLVTFSPDRAQLARAVDTLGLEPGREQGDPLAFAYDTRALTAFAGGAPGDAGRGGGQAALLVEHLQAMASFSNARADEYERGRVRSLIQSIRDLGRTLDAVEGRKDIVYFSEGFQNRFLVGTRETLQEQQWLVEGETWKVDSDKRFGNTPLRSELDEMSRILRRSDCVIHAVDVAGIVAAEDPSEVARIGSENSLFELASGSGGQVLRNANDFRAQLDRLVSRTSLVYVLSFRPDRSEREGSFHDLKVKVGVPGARVSARAGYYERRGFRMMTPLERTLSAADVIANEIAIDDIPARLLAAPFASADGPPSVPVLLEIPGPDLLRGAAGDRLGVEIYLYASDAHNRLTDFFVQSIGVDLARGREKLAAGGIKYFGQLRLPPGAYRLRALVRNAETGRMGFTVSSLRVPEFAADEPYLLAPVFLEGHGDWMTVRGRGEPERAAAGAEPGPGPFVGLAGDRFVPAALPKVPSGSPARVCLIAYHFGTGAEGESLRIGGQVLDGEGKPLATPALQVLGKSAPEPDGKRLLLLSFTPDLSPGRYGLRLFLQDDASGLARQASAAFLVP